ncbi:ATP-dependent endonuclease [Lonepinella sp. MS14435]|uniref:ATP-dependent nuclease n=1 Tax=unclassified Lonepinella TaxID=2642006 RepID=UPI0036D80A61
MSNRSHLVRMHIKNIGCIGNDGLTVDLDDIVCLVGANNSGKTTVLRAYELAVNQESLKPEDICKTANGNSAIVELWVHIPKGVANIDEKWKEEKDDLLLVRSKWEWSCSGGKPERSTWDPESSDYAKDGKAAGLDTVFNSRLPKPFRIGSLDNPQEEHKKLLTLVLEPIIKKYTDLMSDEDSILSKKIDELRLVAQAPITELQGQLDEIQGKISLSYKKVFSSLDTKLNISVGDLGFDLSKSLINNSRIDIMEQDNLVRWDQQGTGSQRTLFWSMLQVRSELNELSEQKKKTEKDQVELNKLKAKPSLNKKDRDKINEIEERLKNSTQNIEDLFLPGYMLLIDEPEAALHPSAIRAAKEHLYKLAAEAGWQVILSTHNPVFVDPLENHTTIVRLHRKEKHLSPNIYRVDEIKFSESELDNLKALMLFDTYLSEMFFGNKVLIVEGDTEFAAFNEVMRLNSSSFPIEERPLIVRARGKATIAILVKMLAHFKINFSILHDIDSPKTPKGEKINPAYSINNKICQEIFKARENGINIIYRCSCPNFEQHHKMKLPSKDKPFASWKKIQDDECVRNSVLTMLNELMDNSNECENDGINYDKILRRWVKENNISEESYCFEENTK